MKSKLTSQSKFLSLVLRHQPEVIGITLDSNGWVPVEELLEALARHGRVMSRELLEEIVATNEKKRFAFSDDGKRIRASQGHSVEIDLALQPQLPPELLYHGTASKTLSAIRVEGLKPMSRQHVHLSPDYETAIKVGSRHGKPIVLVIRAKALFDAGVPFYLSENGVWLTDHVPTDFIDFPE